jgi:polyhydroxybutyrate depolymerase
MYALLLVLPLLAVAEPQRLEFQIGDLKREALVYLPGGLSETPAPVVFGFHGHGGTSRHAAATFRIQELWPEAIVVYMQGVPTPGRLTDPQGKRNGWQHDPGDHGDRDLKFFDAVLATLKEKHKIDDNRVYATGHSNGAAFTYVLWAARHDVLAAIAPSAGSSRSLSTCKPKPVLHIAGENDPLVRFAGQKLVMARVRTINGCGAEGTEWAKDCTLYASKQGTPLVTFIHAGDHKYRPEAPPLIVRFFKEHQRATKS